MKQKMYLLSFLFLVACVPVQSIAPTPLPVTPTAITSPTAVPVPTVTPNEDGSNTITIEGAPTVAPSDEAGDDEPSDPEDSEDSSEQDAKFEDFFNVTSWYELSGTVGGKMPMSCNFGVDRALGNYKIGMPPELAHEICMDKVAAYVHAWGVNGVQGEQPTDAQVAEIEQMFVEVMNGTRSPEDVVVNAPIYPLNQGLDGKYKMTKMSFAMGGMPAAEGAEIIVEHINMLNVKGFDRDPVDNAVTKNKNIPGGVLTHEAGVMSGALWDEDSKTLYLYAGPDYGITGDWASHFVARSLSVLDNWIVKASPRGKFSVNSLKGFDDYAMDLLKKGFKLE